MHLLEEAAGCLKFRPASNEDRHYIEIVEEDPEQCSALVGRLGTGPVKLNLGRERKPKNCFESRVTIQHELMHTLGFYHEHAHPERDNVLKLNWTLLIERGRKYLQNYFKHSYTTGGEQCDQNDETKFNYDDCVSGARIKDLGLPYDWSSVMHYGWM